MHEKLYVVYQVRDEYISPNWMEYVYEVTNNYFTSEKQAKLCVEYLNMICEGCFHIQEVTNKDNVDFEYLIKEHEKRIEEKKIERARETRKNEIQSYALYTSRIEGKDYGELLKEYNDKYAHYIKDGR